MSEGPSVSATASGGWFVTCAQAECDRPDTHKPVYVRTEHVARQIADVRRKQHGTPYGGGSGGE